MSANSLVMAPQDHIRGSSTEGPRTLQLVAGNDLATAIASLATTYGNPGVIELAPGNYPAPVSGNPVQLTAGLTIRAKGVNNSYFLGSFVCDDALNVALSDFVVRPARTDIPMLNIGPSGGNSGVKLTNMSFITTGAMDADVGVLQHADGFLTLEFVGANTLYGGVSGTAGILNLASATPSLGMCYNYGALTVGNLGTTAMIAINMVSPFGFLSSGSMLVFGTTRISGSGAVALTPLTFAHFRSVTDADSVDAVALANLGADDPGNADYEIVIQTFLYEALGGGSSMSAAIMYYSDDFSSASDNMQHGGARTNTLTVGGAIAMGTGTYDGGLTNVVTGLFSGYTVP